MAVEEAKVRQPVKRLRVTSDCFWQELVQFTAFNLPGNFVRMLGSVIDMYLLQ